MIRKIIVLTVFLCIASDMAAHRYTDRILVEINETQDKARAAHQAFLDAKQKILEEDGKRYSDARKHWFECDRLYPNQSEERREGNQNLENALYQLSKKPRYSQYMSDLETKNYYMSKLEGLRLMVDFMSKESDELSEAMLNAINVLPKPDRPIASTLWIEFADDPAAVREKVKSDLHDFVQETAKD